MIYTFTNTATLDDKKHINMFWKVITLENDVLENVKQFHVPDDNLQIIRALEYYVEANIISIDEDKEIEQLENQLWNDQLVLHL